MKETNKQKALRTLNRPRSNKPLEVRPEVAATAQRYFRKKKLEWEFTQQNQVDVAPHGTMANSHNRSNSDD